MPELHSFWYICGVSQCHTEEVEPPNYVMTTGSAVMYVERFNVCAFMYDLFCNIRLVLVWLMQSMNSFFQ